MVPDATESWRSKHTAVVKENKEIKKQLKKAVSTYCYNNNMFIVLNPKEFRRLLRYPREFKLLNICPYSDSQTFFVAVYSIISHILTYR